MIVCEFEYLEFSFTGDLQDGNARANVDQHVGKFLWSCRDKSHWIGSLEVVCEYRVWYLCDEKGQASDQTLHLIVAGDWDTCVGECR